MNEKKARKILQGAGFDADSQEALLEVFSLIGHEHEASDIITGEDETLDEVLESLEVEAGDGDKG